MCLDSTQSLDALFSSGMMSHLGVACPGLPGNHQASCKPRLAGSRWVGIVPTALRNLTLPYPANPCCTDMAIFLGTGVAIIQQQWECQVAIPKHIRCHECLIGNCSGVNSWWKMRGLGFEEFFSSFGLCGTFSFPMLSSAFCGPAAAACSMVSSSHSWKDRAGRSCRSFAQVYVGRAAVRPVSSLHGQVHNQDRAWDLHRFCPLWGCQLGALLMQQELS